MPPLIIALTGFAGVGKDLCASLLSPFGYQRIAFADNIRHQLERQIIDGFPPPPGCPPLDGLTPSDVWLKPTSPQMRCALQWWGTEYRRGEDPAYWLKCMRFIPGQRYVVTDCRFENEAMLVRSLGGEPVRITRPGIGPSDHISECQAWAAHLPEIRNDGTPEQLLQKLISHFNLEDPNA